MDPRIFGKELRKIRNEKNLTQDELADRTGFSKPYISVIENGKQGIPQPRTLRKLAKGLDVPYDFLMLLAGYSGDTNYAQNVVFEQGLKAIDEAFKLRENKGSEVDEKLKEAQKHLINLSKSVQSLGMTHETINQDHEADEKSEEYKHVTKLMDLYYDGVVFWSDDKLLNEVETVIIREHFYHILLRYKELIEAYVSSKHRWKRVSNDFIKMNEDKFNDEDEVYKEEASKGLFLKQELDKNIKMIMALMEAFPAWMAITSDGYSEHGTALKRRLQEEQKDKD